MEFILFSLAALAVFAAVDVAAVRPRAVSRQPVWSLAASPEQVDAERLVVQSPVEPGLGDLQPVAVFPTLTYLPQVPLDVASVSGRENFHWFPSRPHLVWSDQLHWHLFDHQWPLGRPLTQPIRPLSPFARHLIALVMLLTQQSLKNRVLPLVLQERRKVRGPHLRKKQAPHLSWQTLRILASFPYQGS